MGPLELLRLQPSELIASESVLIHVCISMHLRGHLGVPDTVYGPLNAPLNYLVILHQIQLKAYINYMTS